jgi:hypothetical protein
MGTRSRPNESKVADRHSGIHIRFAIKRPAIVALAAFVLSRVVAYLVGVQFESSFLHIGWQLLDLEWLRDDLVGSLATLHSQPPLFNLIVGVLAAVVPGYEHVAMQAFHLLLGAVLTFAMLDLLRRLGVSAGIALTATLLVVLSPASLLYENWLFYPYPLGVVTVLAAWVLCRYTAIRTVRYGMLAFALIAVPALTWSLFHVAWLILTVVLVTAYSGVDARKTLAAAALPLMLVLSWYGKNLALFGEPVASTWFGQNLYRVATGGVSADQRRQLAADLKMSPLAGIAPFSPLSSYRPYVEMPRPTGHAALDEERKQDGTPNFNHVAYIAVSRTYLHLAGGIIKQRPSLYMQAVRRGICRFCLPSTDDRFLEPNRYRIRWADRIYRAVIYGQLKRPFPDAECATWSAAHFPVAMPLLLLASIAGPAWLLSRRSETPDVRVTMAFVSFTILWVVFVGNLFEFGENNRFRYVTEPLMFIALGVSAHRAVGAIRLRGARQSPRPA